MKSKLSALSRRYANALRKHLDQEPGTGLRSALALGHQAAKLDLETLDVARMHEKALATLPVSNRRGGLIKRAELFFAEAITPIENTHRAALLVNLQLCQLNQRVGRRTLDLAASNRSLEQGIAQREALERALKKSVQHSRKLLRDSHRLEKHLQAITHEILSAQEAKRKQISLNLRDDIAQTLLGINVRLQALKRITAVSADDLKKEICSTQRLVDESVDSIKRFACEIGNRTRS